MITRVSQFFQREFTGVHQAAFLLAFTSIIAKLLALFRDRLLASTFGAGQALDIYYASFRIPDFFYTFSLFLAASTALIPLVLEKESQSRESARQFIGAVLSWFCLIMGGVSIVLFFLIPRFVPFVAPGFTHSHLLLVATFSQILLLQSLFLGLSNIVGSVIQSFRLFLVYALSPILYNVGIVVGIAWLYPLWGMYGLIIGVILGAFLHFFIQIPYIIRLGFSPVFSLTITPELKRLFSLSFPRTLGLSINQVVFIAITAFASMFGLGSIAVFNLAYNLQTVPLTIIALSYSIAAFPFLARGVVSSDIKQFLSYFSSAFRHILFWSFPLAVLIIVLRAHIVRVILGAGNFGWIDTRLTAAALALFMLSLVTDGLLMLYVRALYAAGKTKIPVIINSISGGFIIGGVFLFSFLYDDSSGFHSLFLEILRVSDIANTKMLILPFVFSLGSIINLCLIAWYFSFSFGSIRGKDFWKSFFHISIASLCAGVTAFYTLRLLDVFFDLNTFFGIFVHGAIAGLFGVIVAAVFLWRAGNREIREIKDAFHRRFWKKVPVVSGEPASGTEL